MSLRLPALITSISISPSPVMLLLIVLPSIWMRYGGCWSPGRSSTRLRILRPSSESRLLHRRIPTTSLFIRRSGQRKVLPPRRRQSRKNWRSTSSLLTRSTVVRFQRFSASSSLLSILDIVAKPVKFLRNMLICIPTQMKSSISRRMFTSSAPWTI